MLVGKQQKEFSVIQNWKTIPEAARQLGMSRQMLWKRVDHLRFYANQVPFPRYGEHWRYDPHGNRYYINMSADRVQEAFL